MEQLHKIFRLCGTPPEEYWRTSRLPLASMFKPQHPYDSTLRERCSELPKGAVDLIESLLAIQPAKRGTAASALDSEVSEIIIRNSLLFISLLTLLIFRCSISRCGRTRVIRLACRNSPQTKRWMLKPEKTREGPCPFIKNSNSDSNSIYLSSMIKFFRMKGFSSNSRRLRKESSDLCKAVSYFLIYSIRPAKIIHFL